MSSSSKLIINEVFPNPETGSEWIEFYYLEESPVIASDYLDFTISDEKRILYTFRGDEIWSNNFLLIQVSGLNNDQDSVILKNAEELIVDQMSYDHSQKNLSWSRINADKPLYILGEASPLFENIIAPSETPRPTPTFAPSPTPPATVDPSIANPSVNPSREPINITSPAVSPIKTDQNNNAELKKDGAENESNDGLLSSQELAQRYFTNYQNYHNLQISYAQEKQFPQTRLVFLGQKILKPAIIDAIIGSSLLLIAAILLSYDNKTKRKKENFSSLF